MRKWKNLIALVMSREEGREEGKEGKNIIEHSLTANR